MKRFRSCLAVVVMACGGTREGSPLPGAESSPATPVVDSGSAWFVDATAASGVVFHHHHGGNGEKNFIETMGGGVVVADLDSDGDLDAYSTQSGPLPGTSSSPEIDSISHLFLNRGDGHFEDRTENSGAENRGYAMGAVAADFDNDGLADIYVLNFGANRLLHNLGAGRFEDVTLVAGVGDPAWSVSAAWGDLDNDGLLDLYVANYLDFTMDNNIWCGRKSDQIRAYCHPDQYNGVRATYYRNNGDGSFRDMTTESGLDSSAGKGLGVVLSDLDDDGDLDIFGANDSTINYAWRNRGDGHFSDAALASGLGYSEDGKPQACMGADVADYDGDGRFDVFTTNLDLEYNTLYRNLGNFSFADISYTTGIVDAHLLFVGFGTEFVDVDLDGWPDLVVLNGHIIDNIPDLNDSLNYAQPMSLFRNLAGKKFQEVSSGTPAFQKVRVGRGLASGDLDADGDVDLLIGNNNQPAELLLRSGKPSASFMVIATRGVRSNRDGIGARVTVTTGDRRVVDEIRAGSSYASSSDPRLTVGLGSSTAVDRVEIRWPSGTIQRFEQLPVNVLAIFVEDVAAPLVSRIGGPQSP